MTKPIPQPKPHLLFGNASEMDQKAPMQSMMRLAKEYGPIYKLQFPGKELVVVSSQELVNELCDETRFDKQVHGILLQQREVSGDGLFTARTEEPNWGLAHRILMPAFGPASLRNLFDPMWDIAEQMLLHWERHGDSVRLDVADQMTRLALDTIALCAFSYRFNSFYGKELHPYINAMGRVLLESGPRSRRPPLMTRLMVFKARQRAEDIRLMHQTANEVIAHRKAEGEAGLKKKDLLALMLAGRDPKTGRGLSDENIRCQMTTFLTAGHETTSGLLTFTFYEMLDNPAVLAKAQAEVDRVLGNELPRYEHLPKFVYLDQIFKESLRLWPTAPAFALQPYEDETTIGGYPVKKGQTLLVLLPSLHRDPKVWGDDADQFNPDRMAPELFEKLPPNAWKPFGNGQRACIGRPFALQEATLVMAAILQRFELSKADSAYKLKIKEVLTIKPDGFFMKVKRRDVVIARGPAAAPGTTPATQPTAATPAGTVGIPLKVLFGSNSGSCEAFAQRIATDAKAQGYASSIGTLDSAVGHLPKEGAVVIVTASYEGHPADNAKEFVTWLNGLGAGSLAGVKFAVFGCGNKDWSRTYQAIPKLIDEKLAAAGATRLVERGAADARGDFFGDFDKWYAPFWKAIGSSFGRQEVQAAPAPKLDLEFVEGARDPILRQNNLARGEVIDNHELSSAEAAVAGRSRRHIEIALPAGVTYRAGDYVSVLPSNPAESVGRVLRRFGLAYDAQVVVRSSTGVQTFFPTGQPVLAGELLASFVELGLPATRQQIKKLVASTSDPDQKKSLEALVDSDELYTAEILGKRVSVPDLLERYPSCDVAFGSLLEMLPPLKPRQYSISSSPRWSPEHVTVTIAVVTAPAWSGHGVFRGVASNYLANARPGMKVAVTARPSQAAFHLPDSLETPIVMVGAGTGVAPFRGFLQERALRAEEEGRPGDALLFFGCHHPDEDFLYKDELQLWESEGIVKLRMAFSAVPNGDVKHVQHRLWQDRAEVMELMEKGARIYVCGDGRHMAPAVRETFGKMHQELTNCTADQVQEWLAELEKSIRYSQDVFS